MSDTSRDCCRHCNAFLPFDGQTLGCCRAFPPRADQPRWPAVDAGEWCRHFAPPADGVRTEGLADEQFKDILPCGMPALRTLLRDLKVSTLRELAALTAAEIRKARAERGRDPGMSKYGHTAGDLLDVKRLLALAGLRLKGE